MKQTAYDNQYIYLTHRKATARSMYHRPGVTAGWPSAFMGPARASCSDLMPHDSLCPSQQFFSYVWTGLPGLNQYLAKINMSFSRTQHSDTGEAWTHNPSVLSQALHHWATALPSGFWWHLFDNGHLLEQIR